MKQQKYHGVYLRFKGSGLYLTHGKIFLTSLTPLVGFIVDFRIFRTFVTNKNS